MRGRLQAFLKPGIALVLSVLGTASPAQSRVDSNVVEREVDGATVASERDEQRALFEYYFRDRGLQYETVLDALSDEATVPAWRIPYSASIHPETQGGLSSARATRVGLFRRRTTLSRSGSTSSALTTYDRAFHGGQDLANAYELRRIRGEPPRGLFAALRTRSQSEPWEGYCSGFTASSIRHPEPVQPVDAGDIGGAAGVVLQPSEIKALLSCVYNRTLPDSYLYLAPPSAADGGPNMGTFHLALANYVGQAGHPIGIDRTKGQVSWNNPIYAYRVDSIRDAGSDGQLALKDVVTTITYTFYGSDTDRQTDPETGERVRNRKQSMTLRYTLALNDAGEIVGGRARGDSGHFLWIPLYPVQATPDGSAPGNPHVDVQNVLALARASVPLETQERFDQANIGSGIEPSDTPESTPVP
jgi:hypothetical protein